MDKKKGVFHDLSFINNNANFIFVAITYDTLSGVINDTKKYILQLPKQQ